jgi:hypothetical protein
VKGKLLDTLVSTFKRPLLGVVVICLLTGFATFGIQLSFRAIDVEAISAEGLGESRLLRLLAVFQGAIGDSFPSDIFVFAGVLVLFFSFLRIERRQRFSVRTLLLTLFFAFFTCIGRAMTTDIGFNQIDIYVVARILVFAGAFIIVCYPALIVIEAKVVSYLTKTDAWEHDERECKNQATKRGRFTDVLFFRHSFLAPFILILICWLPYLILCYPGTTDPYDVLDQLTQYHGSSFRTPLWINPSDPNILLNNNNPVFHTVLVNLFVDFGMNIGSQSFGFFLYVLIQFVTLAASLAASVSYLRTFNTPPALRKLILLGICLIPLFPAWAVCVTKDVPFASLVVLYVIFLMRAVTDPRQFERDKRLFVGFFLICVLMTLVRNNGMHLVVLSAPFLFLLKDRWHKLLAVNALTAAVCFLLYSNLLLPALSISGGSIKEVLSVPIQQTALYVREYPDEVTADEKAAISRVLPYEDIAAAYNPEKADNVKDAYFKDADGEDLAAYMKAWASMGLKHPLIYIAATAVNCSAYFYPGADTSWIWMNLNHYGRYDQLNLVQEYHDYGFDLAQVDVFEPERNLLRELFMLFLKTPLSYLVNIGACAWVLMFSSVVLWKHRVGKALIPFAPTLALLLICIASPLNGSVRYALPYIFSTIPLLMFACCALREKLHSTQEGDRDRREGL